MPSSIDRDLVLAHVLADEADRIAGEAFVAGRAVEYELKGDGTPVTEIDRAVEQALLELVRRERPDDAFLGEEVGSYGRGRRRRRWCIDGIDGTSDLIEGSALWGTLIALVEDDRPVLGLSTSWHRASQPLRMRQATIRSLHSAVRLCRGWRVSQSGRAR